MANATYVTFLPVETNVVLFAEYFQIVHEHVVVRSIIGSTSHKLTITINKVSIDTCHLPSTQRHNAGFEMKQYWR